VLDRGIATLDGQRIAPHRGGRTSIVVEAGGGSEEIPLTVVERVRTLAVLPPAGQAVGVPVRIAQDSVARWSLPAGRLWLQFVARSPARTDVDGAPCATLPAPVPGTLLECTVSERGASISIAATDGPAAGLLVLRRAF